MSPARLTLAFLLAVLVIAAPVSAQDSATSARDSASRDLTVATTAYLAASMADELSTMYALAPGSFETVNADGSISTVRTWERNPMFNWGPRPLMHAVGLGVTAGTAYGLHRWLGSRHPRLATMGLLALAGARSLATLNNFEHGRSVRRLRSVAITIRVR